MIELKDVIKFNLMAHYVHPISKLLKDVRKITNCGLLCFHFNIGYD